MVDPLLPARVGALGVAGWFLVDQSYAVPEGEGGNVVF